MRRISIWPMLVLFLLGALLLREPRFEKQEENFLRWMLRNTQMRTIDAPLTVIDVGRDHPLNVNQKPASALHGSGTIISPLEYSLFLQTVLEFQPNVIAFENVLQWRERDKDQQQVFLDQAMRVPRLLLAAELTTTPDPDAPDVDMPTFSHVTGSRRDLVEFSGIGRQPDEDFRLISTAGFINLPSEIVDDLHVPLLFRYRGEVIPSFALQAIMLWKAVTPNELKVDLNSGIFFPDGRRIPIQTDGTIMVNPGAAQRVRHLTLSELMFAAQQRGSGGLTKTNLENLREQLVLARAPENPHSPPAVFAATIATMQSGLYLRRVSHIFDFTLLVLATLAAGFLARISRIELLLFAIAITAAYGLISLALLSHFLLWLPGYFPLGMIWLLVVVGMFGSRPAKPEALEKISD